MLTIHPHRIGPPGGAAVLAGRPVARIGFGAMQLPGPRISGPPRWAWPGCWPTPQKCW